MAGTQLRTRDVYEQIKAKLWTERASFDAHAREIADYLKPRRIRLNTSDRNKGDKRNQNILDPAGTQTARTLASGLYAGMCSPAREWFRLTTPDPSMAESEPIKRWLFAVKSRMESVFILSNLYNALPEVLGDVGLFGTAAMGVFEDDEDLIRAYVYPFGSYAVGLDRRKRVCTFVLEDQMTVRQVIEEFGEFDAQGRLTNPENFSTWVREAWAKPERREDAVDVCWIVMPNDQYNPSKLSKKYTGRFSSCWFESGSNQTRDLRSHTGVLRESGFATFPIMVPRWSVTSNDSYGVDCPGMLMLPDVKQLQFMVRKANQWLKKIVEPPLKGPSSLRNQPTSLVGDAITYVDVREGQQSLEPVYQLDGAGYQFLLQAIAEVKQNIKRSGFEDMFLMFQSSPYGGTQPPTAREVQERHDEKLLELGPTLERMNDELFDPLIDRVFDLMQAAGLIPQPPAELDGVTLRVEFTSILAEAQKLTRVLGTDRFVSSVAPLAQVDPSVLDKVDTHALVDEYAAAFSLNPKVIRPTEAAQAIAQQRQQAEAAAQAAVNARQLAGAAKDAAQTPMGGDTALAALTGAGAAA